MVIASRSENPMQQVELTLYISGQFVEVRTEVDPQAWLNAVFSRVLTRKLNRAARNGANESLQDLAESLAKAITVEELADASDLDEVEAEALALAEADVTAQLAREGLPTPRSIRDHAQQLVNANQGYMDKARARLKARAEVVRETLSEAEL